GPERDVLAPRDGTDPGPAGDRQGLLDPVRGLAGALRRAPAALAVQARRGHRRADDADPPDPVRRPGRPGRPADPGAQPPQRAGRRARRVADRGPGRELARPAGLEPTTFTAAT